MKKSSAGRLHRRRFTPEPAYTKMNKAILILFVVLTSLSCDTENGDSISPVPKVNVGEKIKGGSILQTWKFASSGSRAPSSTDMAVKTNAEWVSLSPVVGVSQLCDGPCRPYSFRPSDETEKMKVIIPKMINSGLTQIMLKPITSFWTVNGSSFWGHFYVDTEEEWADIENAYGDLFYELAKLSETFPEIKLLSIGNELNEFTQRRPQFFRSLISRIRSDFPDLALTYAANWDEYQSVSFWGDLDYIGVNPYFSLVDQKTPTLSEIEQALSPIKQDMLALSWTFQKPILFTEYGFRSMDYGTWQPWLLGDILIDYRVNFQVQETSYKAFFNTFWEEPWVAGGFFWEWRVLFNEEIFNPNNNGWYINDKPAEKVIKDRYTK